MGKILLFYMYTPIEYPKRFVKWQKKLCNDLHLTGRILIGHEGINGTLSGSEKNTDRYKNIMLAHESFKDIDFKESPGNTKSFPRLYVTTRDEIVHLGVDPNAITPKDGGIHLSPDEVHNLIQNNSDDLVIFDTRNEYEWRVGRFISKKAKTLLPHIRYFRELPAYIDQHVDEFKDKQVLMYCTGGIRCERATTYLKTKNIAKKVYQIRGGIHRYVEQYPDGFFRGKNYVFDNRITVPINDDVLGACHLCKTACDTYENCMNAYCNLHFIACTSCTKKYNSCCSDTCKELIRKNLVKKRPSPQQTAQSRLQA